MRAARNAADVLPGERESRGRRWRPSSIVASAASTETSRKLRLDPAAIDVGVVTIDVGGVAGETQFVKLDGAVGAFSASPTDVLFFMVQDGGGQLTANNAFTLAAPGPSGFAIESGATTAVVAVPSGTTQTFRLKAAEFAGTGGASVWGELSAVTAPFGATGTNTLGEATTAKASSAGVQRKK